MSNTGADGVSIARGAMYSPWIFADITGRSYNKKSLILQQLEDTKELYGERFACVFMRKMIAFYIKGIPNSTDVKINLFKCRDCEEVKKILLTLNI